MVRRIFSDQPDEQPDEEPEPVEEPAEEPVEEPERPGEVPEAPEGVSDARQRFLAGEIGWREYVESEQ